MKNHAALLTDHANHANAAANAVERPVNAQSLALAVTIANVAKDVVLKKHAANVFKFAARLVSAVQITTAVRDVSVKNANQNDLNFSIFCVVDKLSTKSKIITSAR